jgi:hypothetical protein
MLERKHYFKVRYASKHIETICAHSKWEAIDMVYSKNIQRYGWIQRRLLTAVRSYGH